MTRFGLRTNRAGDDPPCRSVPFTVVLTRDEEGNITRCLGSARRASQVVVVDSGSEDGTVRIVRSVGADTGEQPWLGFSAQREVALQLPEIRHAGWYSRSRVVRSPYMVRLGFLDGPAGWRFCFFHAWYQAAVDGFAAEPSGRLM